MTRRGRTFVNAETKRSRAEEDLVLVCTDVLVTAQGNWYLVSDSWLAQWRNFAVRGSASDDKPIEPPGAICNQVLLKKNGKPKSGLLPIQHYRGISKQLWDYFFSIYGGGPEIVRSEIDIYGPEPKNYVSTTQNKETDHKEELESGFVKQ